MTLLAAVGCSGHKAPPSVTPTAFPWGLHGDSFNGFTSASHHYSLDYPASWLAQAGAENDVFTPGDDADTLVLIEFGPGPDLSVDDPELEETMIEAIRGHYGGDATFVGIIDTGSRRALLLEWTTPGMNAVYGMQAWVPKGDQTWYITFRTPAHKKSDYKGDFLHILYAFRPD